MSITINLYYTGNGDAARKFAEEMEASGIAEAIRSEDGNERYEYFFPMNDGTRFHMPGPWATIRRTSPSMRRNSLFCADSFMPLM